MIEHFILINGKGIISTTQKNFQDYNRNNLDKIYQIKIYYVLINKAI